MCWMYCYYTACGHYNFLEDGQSGRILGPGNYLEEPDENQPSRCRCNGLRQYRPLGLASKSRSKPTIRGPWLKWGVKGGCPRHLNGKDSGPPNSVNPQSKDAGKSKGLSKSEQLDNSDTAPLHGAGGIPIEGGELEGECRICSRRNTVTTFCLSTEGSTLTKFSRLHTEEELRAILDSILDGVDFDALERIRKKYYGGR